MPKALSEETVNYFLPLGQGPPSMQQNEFISSWRRQDSFHKVVKSVKSLLKRDQLFGTQCRSPFLCVNCTSETPAGRPWRGFRLLRLVEVVGEGSGP